MKLNPTIQQKKSLKNHQRVHPPRRNFLFSCKDQQKKLENSREQEEVEREQIIIVMLFLCLFTCDWWRYDVTFSFFSCKQDDSLEIGLGKQEKNPNDYFSFFVSNTLVMFIIFNLMFTQRRQHHFFLTRFLVLKNPLLIHNC